MEPLPILVLITGTQGSGKSTLGNALSMRLGLPLVKRDEIKSGIATSVGKARTTGGPPQPDTQDMLPRGVIAQRTFDAFPRIVESYLDHGVSCMLEHGWLPGTTHVLVPCLAKSRAVSIHCTTDEGVLLRRIMDRANANPADLYNPDAQLLKDIGSHRTAVTARSAPLDLDVPRIVVDTTDGYEPAVEEVCRFVWQTANGAIAASGI